MMPRRLMFFLATLFVCCQTIRCVGDLTDNEFPRGFEASGHGCGDLESYVQDATGKSALVLRVSRNEIGSPSAPRTIQLSEGGKASLVVVRANMPISSCSSLFG